MPSGQPRSFHDRFKFIVEIDGFQSAGFNKCSELSVEAAKIEYYEGGGLIPHKSPGRLSYSDVTLERGATIEQDMYDWFAQVGNAGFQGTAAIGAGSGRGEKDNGYKRQVDIVQLDRDGTTRRRWRLYNAWPQKFTAGEWDNDSDEKVIEMVTLNYDYFELIKD